MRASSLERLHLCPGSDKACDGLPLVSSIAAERGTLLHQAMKNLIDPLPDAPGIPKWSLSEHFKNPNLTAEDSAVIQEIFRNIHSNRGEGILKGEFSINLSFLGLENGTIDLLEESPVDPWIVDYKFGVGWVPPASDNLQLAAYGCGVAADYARQGIKLNSVELTIMQPLALNPDNRVSSVVLSMPELRECRDKIKSITRQAALPNAPLRAGEIQCKFCPAKKQCPAFAKFAGKLDQAKKLAEKAEIQSVSAGNHPVVVTPETPIETPVVVVSEELVTQCYDILNRMKKITVTDSLTASAVGDMSKEARQLITSIEKNRKLLKAPILSYGRAIDAAADLAEKPLEEAALRADQELGAWYRAQEEAKKKLWAEAEAAEAARQAQLKAAQEASALAANSLNKKSREKAQAIAEEAFARAEEEAEKSRKASAAQDVLENPAKIIGYRSKEEITSEIPDLLLVPQEFFKMVLIPNQKAIDALVKSGALNEKDHSAWLRITRKTVAARSR